MTASGTAGAPFPPLRQTGVRGKSAAMRFLFPLLCVLLLAIPAPLRADPPAAVSPLVGTWRLLRYEDTPEGGTPVRAFGAQPIGQFVFTADGHAAISIMRNPPDPAAATTDIDPDACLPAWYCSYFGTWRPSADGGGWIVHVAGGNIPSYLGTDQERRFTIAGDRLTVSETYRAEGRPVHAVRILERVR